VLGVFQKLAASRAQDHQGFFILNAFVECLPLEAWVDFLPSVWSVLFARLQSSKTVKFTKCLVVFISLLCCKHGPLTVVDSMAKVQPGIFEMLMKGVVCDAIPTVSGESEEKVLAVACARFVSEAPSIVGDHQTWAKLVTAATTTLEKSDDLKNAEAAARGETNDLDDALEAAEKNAGYAASYSKLSNASKKVTDPCADVADAKIHLAIAISKIAQAQPGVFGNVIAQNCPPEVQHALQQYCAAAGVGIV
jgi:exportin-2 (importin alpha re-exporter)